ncbi:ATP-binding protein [Telmatobacter sp. DSM 110680]|uniref:histidine kinase n=1 Tax=Telmatobacter sp. DSM 110680 TaxID=3036704 RepID=A0AAU7DQ41_9BACT
MSEARNPHGNPRAFTTLKQAPSRMETSLFNRLQATLLALATVGLVILAVLNFRQESKFQQPNDGVWWVETNGGLLATKIIPDGPGKSAGIQTGDLLTAVNDHPVARVADLERELYRTGIWIKTNYQITRSRVPLDTPVVVIPEPTDRSSYQGLRFIGLVYLAIGVYILFRRWTAPRATHFFLFCLVSFALYALKYTGELNLVDQFVFWSNIVAGALQPALFLHFAISFPEERLKDGGRRWLLPILYTPSVALIGFWITAMTRWQATGILLHRLDQVNYGYIATFYVLAATLFSISYVRANTPLLRQQLKWLYRGAWLAVGPFTLLFAVPFLLDIRLPSLLTKLAGLSLVFLPLTFCWAIIRYRLMDTDLIFKRGVAYTLATATLLGAYFGVIALVAQLINNGLPEAISRWGFAVAILVTAALFDPLKRRIQSWVDKAFDRQKYDYRKALIEFGRGLSSETNLDALLESIVERLPRTLLVSRVAVFLAQPTGGMRLAASHGLLSSATERKLALGFLDFDRAAVDHSHIFLENAQQALHLPPEQQRAAALLDLNYYLPCRLQDGATARTIAVIGLGRTTGGDFLSSEDVELLESLASYIGIALQNASLYARLEEKISEFERLKEFNENIVESINVGILALDLEDRIESWNAQMEAMYAVSRSEALGQKLSSVFPDEFVSALEGFRNEPGVHHLYKFHLTTKAGEQRTVNIAIAPLLSRDFVIVGRIVLVDDITERVSLENQLAQSDKLSSIGLLAAGVAHEINTPLAVISSYAQMLSKQMRGDARLGPVLEKITQQSFRASEIANGLLNFSRTSTTEFRETNLNQVIRDTLSLLEHQFKTAQIIVDAELIENLPTIHGNPGKLQQVFLNLLLNAKESMPGGGRLRVATQFNGHVEAVVSDSGSGIAPEHLKRIYDPFFTTKTMPRPGERRGTGLGLSVSYGIIQEHAGKIHVESAIGAGTTFHLEFPLLRKSVHV